MVARLAKVSKHSGDAAPGSLQGVGEFGHPAEVAAFVDSAGDGDDVRIKIRGVECDGVERVAEVVPEEVSLGGLLRALEPCCCSRQPRSMGGRPVMIIRFNSYRAAAYSLLRDAPNDAT